MTKKLKKWILIILGVGVCFAAGKAVMPDHSFENLSNVTKEAGFYRITFDEWSEVEIPEQNMPEATLRKWGDETFIKVSYPDFSPVAPKQDESKLKWQNGNKEVHLYPLESREFVENGETVKQLEQGGFEFKIILKKKPKTNKIVLNIETRGLDFFYQSPLTQEEIDKGDFRPENVIGSYAVYHDTKQPLHASNEEAEKYKVGKAFHIYRPRLIDSNGWEIWADLHIDPKKGTYEVTIPENFYNNAIYPISSNDTFGYENKGGTSMASDQFLGTTFEAPASGDITSITVYIKDKADYSTDVNLGYFNGGVGAIGTNVAYGTAADPGLLDTWYQHTVSGAITGGNDYWLTHQEDGHLYYKYKDTGATDQGFDKYSWTFDDWGDNPTVSYGTEKISIYCTYTPSAAAVPYIPSQNQIID